MLAAEISRIAATAHNEEELRIGVEKLLEPVLERLGVRVEPAYERTYVSGHSDAVYGRVVLEYERPGTLARKQGVDRCLDQLDRYMRAEADAAGGGDAYKRMIGVGLDGNHILFARFRRGTPKHKYTAPHETALVAPDSGDDTGDLQLDHTDLYRVAYDSIESLLLYIRALRRKPLTPEGLSDEFGPDGTSAQQLVSSLYNALLFQDNTRIKTFFREWDRLFGIVYGQDVSKAAKAARRLAIVYGIARPVDLKPLLFAVHTYYALLMKLLSAELVAMHAAAYRTSILADLQSSATGEVTALLRDLEEGGLFARLGIRNFLEGDFFSWYLEAWDPDIEDGVRQLARSFDQFEVATSSLEPQFTRDLLKKLYQYLLPAELRHDLGEYYTPDWLAELTLDRAGYDGDLTKRFLDPACGSGTFLVLAMRRALAKATANGTEPAVAARHLASNVVGFDLNPLAVIAARTNVLLALGPLIRELIPLDLPVYLCDSVLGPVRHESAQQTFEDAYVIPSTVGEFHVPRSIVENDALPRFTALLEDAVEGAYTVAEFKALVKSQIGAIGVMDEVSIESLFSHVVGLKRDGRDGIWARIIKNAFAPIFAGRFDFVVGNPPWVNWEDLSADYRDATEKLWHSYGLTTARGQLGRMREGKKDLSMLMLYAAAANYLNEGGTLAFLVTQTLFKTKGAGDGFRRFQIGSGDHLGVRCVEDMSKLNPFEGATNKTAMIVLSKGRRTIFPVQYGLWSKTTTGRVPVGAVAKEVEERTARVAVAAEPVHPGDLQSPWLTGPAAAIKAVRRVRAQSSYTARLGTNTGGLNAAYWLRILDKRGDDLIVVENLHDVGRRGIRRVEAAVETDLVHPLIRGRDIRRWSAHANDYVLLPQDRRRQREGIAESQLKIAQPNTWKFLKKFEDELTGRADRKYYPKGAPFYTMRNVASYTYSPYKVVWPEVGHTVTAAVVAPVRDEFLGRRAVIPAHSAVFIPTEHEDEAHYVCALLNSSPAQVVVRGYVTLHPSPHVMEHVRVPEFDRRDEMHRALARLSMEAHAAWDDDALQELERDVDERAAQLWAIPPLGLAHIRKAVAASLAEDVPPAGR